VFAPVAFHAVASLTQGKRRRLADAGHVAADERRPDGPVSPARSDREMESQ
jgi:HAE1 family hydrophobic/amphiphilic exporter-1